MKTLFRWILLVLTIGGGFAGLMVALQVIFNSDARGLAPVVWGVVLAVNIYILLAGCYLLITRRASHLWRLHLPCRYRAFHHRFWSIPSAWDFVSAPGSLVADLARITD